MSRRIHGCQRREFSSANVANPVYVHEFANPAQAFMAEIEKLVARDPNFSRETYISAGLAILSHEIPAASTALKWAAAEAAGKGDAV